MSLRQQIGACRLDRPSHPQHIAELLRDDLTPWIQDPGRVTRALDLCTGSGCLAVLLAHSFVNARVDAADLSRPALQVAHRNVSAYRLASRVTLVQSDLYANYWKIPDMDRIEFGKDKTKPVRVDINHGFEGWRLTQPAKGKDLDVAKQSEAEIDEFLKGFRTSFNYVMRFVVNAPKATLVNAGSTTVDTKRADILEIRDAQKNLMRVYIDRETRYPLKVQTRLTDEQFTDEWLYANWHEFDGVMTPLLVVRYRDGVKLQETRVETVAYNPGFPDSLFAPPSKAK